MGVYPYEHMASWERFSELSLPNKKAFFSGLYMENINDVDYRHEFLTEMSSDIWGFLAHLRPSFCKF